MLAREQRARPIAARSGLSAATPPREDPFHIRRHSVCNPLHALLAGRRHDPIRRLIGRPGVTRGVVQLRSNGHKPPLQGDTARREPKLGLARASRLCERAMDSTGHDTNCWRQSRVKPQIAQSVLRRVRESAPCCGRSVHERPTSRRRGALTLLGRRSAQREVTPAGEKGRHGARPRVGPAAPAKQLPASNAERCDVALAL